MGKPRLESDDNRMQCIPFWASMGSPGMPVPKAVLLTHARAVLVCMCGIILGNTRCTYMQTLINTEELHTAQHLSCPKLWYITHIGTQSPGDLMDAPGE